MQKSTVVVVVVVVVVVLVVVVVAAVVNTNQRAWQLRMHCNLKAVRRRASRSELTLIRCGMLTLATRS